MMGFESGKQGREDRPLAVNRLTPTTHRIDDERFGSPRGCGDHGTRVEQGDLLSYDPLFLIAPVNKLGRSCCSGKTMCHCAAAGWWSGSPGCPDCPAVVPFSFPASDRKSDGQGK